MKSQGRDRFLALLKESVGSGALVKLTLAKPSGTDKTLRNLFVRPVALKAGSRLAFVWHHSNRDSTKNLDHAEALAQLEAMIGRDFGDAHLFTMTASAQLETGRGSERLRVKAAERSAVASAGNDRRKKRPIDPGAPWLRLLGVTDDRGRPAAGMADKFRQIERFAELLGHMVDEAPIPVGKGPAVFDMGCGKGYLTFAACDLLGEEARVVGVEARADLVAFCNKASEAAGFAPRLAFRCGSIADTDAGSADVMIALHACDTATDDALAKGVAAGSALLVAAPCCQKELRPQIEAPPVLAPSLRHGIFLERQAEFVTDSLRAQLLEWAGYRVKVFEFISTEHTAKNTMISAVRAHEPGDGSLAAGIRSFAAFYGIRRQALAAHLGFPLR
jgi:SAM-dependent methyltransferase